MNGEKVIIVGAGVAGLSLAIMLAEQNIESQVLESREHFDGPTSGVRISTEGVKVMKLMELDAIGEETGRFTMLHGGLSTTFSTVSEPDASAIVVTRTALHEQLMKRARSLRIRVVNGFKVTTARETADGVEVTSESSEEVTGTLIVGADGVGSQIRRFLNPGHGSTKAYAGYLGVGLLTAGEPRLEMEMHNYPGQWIGMASCGKVSESASRNSIFMWTHLHMSEDDAKLATRASVEAELSRRAEKWRPELRRRYDLYANDAEAILAYGPVYNGKPPAHWYSRRMMLIGDAAHPYGPGGQGISMALKDARALRDVIVDGFTEEEKREFQESRGREAGAAGEAAEKRNAKAPPSTRLGVITKGIATKAMAIATRGRLKEAYS